jgi:hypothetical protein
MTAEEAQTLKAMSRRTTVRREKKQSQDPSDKKEDKWMQFYLKVYAYIN